jgi:hypothetical protein
MTANLSLWVDTFEGKIALDKNLIMKLLLQVAEDGVVQGVLAQGHQEWNRQIKKSLLVLASEGYIELLSEMELTEVGLRINCKILKHSE